VIIDLLERDQVWGPWSRAQLSACAVAGPTAINHHIYAEVAASFGSVNQLNEALADFARLQFPWEAAFMAGQTFKAYRERGGARQSILPDFYIGAHAAVAGLRLLTRDAARYRTYFPTIDLIAPA
jgi:predicted nucleic acid-binding protein